MSKILTRQIIGLDYRIWRVLLIFVILSAGLVSYKMMDRKTCKPVKFTIRSILTSSDTAFTVGDNLSFKTQDRIEDITWDFGDKSANETGALVMHQYMKSGEYIVMTISGSSCVESRKVIIRPLMEVQQSSDVATGQEIIGPASTPAGKEVMYSSMVLAEHYEWVVLNYPKMTQLGPSGKFRFPFAGKFTVQLTLNDDRNKRYKKEIIVEEPVALPSPVPEKIDKLITSEAIQIPIAKRVNINDQLFAEYLQKVVDKDMKAEDFDDYLCYKGQTKALVNGELTNFDAMCNEISGKKKRKLIFYKKSIKISSTILRRDHDGCVNIVEVQYH